MPDQSFYDRLQAAMDYKKSQLVVGIDPHLDLIPDFYKSDDGGVSNSALFDFFKSVIDITADYAAIFKPQIAFFSALAAEDALQECIRYIQDEKKAMVLLDAKRSDIGSTAKAYAMEAFERYGADAVTVNPLLGSDCIAPFAEYQSKGSFVLCKTSNPSSSEYQNLSVPLLDATLDDYSRTQPLYITTATYAKVKWNANKNIGLVVGGTFPSELKAVRQVVGDAMPILIPGIGTQGGTIASIRAVDDSPMNLFSVSRSVSFLSKDKDENKILIRNQIADFHKQQS